MTKPTAIITGGSGGMGLATAQIMAADHHLVLTDLDDAALTAAVEQIEALGGSAEYVVADITARSQVDEVLAAAQAAGRLRAVVHAAGVSPHMGDAAKIIDINAVGTVNVTRAAYVVADDGFALVNVASIAGQMLPRIMVPTRAFRYANTHLATFRRKLIAAASRTGKKAAAGQAYSISKAFVIWYSAEQAADFGAKGARILSVSPGSFDTEMGRLEEDGGAGRMTDFAALKRFGRPEEIAELLAFCASDKPGYLTGIDILCDGGTKAGMGFKEMLTLAREA
ncbi:putative 3-alpha-(or 20-beta)-hydroxysteroid dehydrogenase [Gordonia hirsuta DSM 44140 = NBRC 16056]|uniref:Putative 3-alpha-(Or 20-beta)-hydroxysteroid dehydrogenase n=1 Tax=Gordonia hirsuta DSM 44140 = NBRC 16056 TaxID=1121927 RepID=L7LAM4_9ACTN|nr:SDR family oxidoreductase [Gordonia hirsuta]GAC58195.1 putative 3-alpha-(or 20-beta)-hydroxysteroid dehydrogenase [Gordonia hirsuta DSM 44140 = NBRC 16056]